MLVTAGSFHVLHLGGPDLVVNLAHGLAIGCSDDGGHDLRIELVTPGNQQ
jgi:hypothetical protein